MEYKLIICSSEEKAKYILENRNSKVFNKNLKTIELAIQQNKYVTFAGRNLYIIHSEEHNLVKKKVAEAVKKCRNKKSSTNDLKRLNAEIERLNKEKNEKQEALEFITKHFAQFQK